MLLAVLLSTGALTLVALIVFNLSVYALPAFVGIAAVSLAHRTGAGLIGTAIIGLTIGALVHAAGQIAFSAARGALARICIAAVYTIPAVVAGYYAVLGVVELCVPGAFWRQSFSVLGAAVVGAASFSRLAAVAPLRVERGQANASPDARLAARAKHEPVRP